ncbi:heparinase II/III family protein [Halodesulfovibrio aestuarii]|uniref:Heparinase II/III family protein n=1 Tax=Halodesulfovibrio aestuarii TaxID=126333 RepID=A0ABV4JWZ2_9BACT
MIRRFFLRALLLFHTVKYLRTGQLLYRIYYRFRKKRTHPFVRPSLRNWLKTWDAPVWQQITWKQPDEFCFLNVSNRIGSCSDWNNDRYLKLWLYNAHYLDVLNARDMDGHVTSQRALLTRWVSENPEPIGNGWEPYCISLRLVNTIKWMSRNGQYDNLLLSSVHQQAASLFDQIEFHILGNHLFANAKALVFAGTFCETSEANVWLEKGLKILDQQVPEQFLNDGAHFELSPMYHAILLWDLCDLINLSQRSGVAFLRQREELWKRALCDGLLWLQKMVHPDGNISFFNDSALAIAPNSSELLEYAYRIGIEVKPPKSATVFDCTHLASSGYISVELPNNGKAILDVGRVGPDYQPGHAHADTLSFECSLFGERVFVNSGTSEYGNSNERLRQRGTASHNTVQVNGRNSSEVWDGFRVARRAEPQGVSITSNGCYIKVFASHDGYVRQGLGCTHQRSWTFTRDHLELVDRVFGEYDIAEMFLHLHPDVYVNLLDDNSVELLLRAGKKIYLTSSGVITPLASTWHPEFGKIVPSTCLSVEFTGKLIETSISWKQIESIGESC